LFFVFFLSRKSSHFCFLCSGADYKGSYTFYIHFSNDKRDNGNFGSHPLYGFFLLLFGYVIFCSPPSIRIYKREGCARVCVWRMSRGFEKIVCLTYFYFPNAKKGKKRKGGAARRDGFLLWRFIIFGAVISPHPPRILSARVRPLY
jgi:hypothetical protein